MMLIPKFISVRIIDTNAKTLANCLMLESTDTLNDLFDFLLKHNQKKI